MPKDDTRKEGARPQRSLLRRAGLALVSVLFVLLAFVSTSQILKAAFFPDVNLTTLEFTCRDGTRALYKQVEEARALARKRTLPEREALRQFRSDLDPIWSQAPDVRALCQKNDDLKALKALRSVELLRYAEERVVRTSALDLQKMRQRTPDQVNALGPLNEENQQ